MEPLLNNNGHNSQIRLEHKKMTSQKYFCYSQGSVVVDAELIFNNVTTLPNASSTTETLEAAVSTSNFSLPVNTSSISATGKTLCYN